MMERWVRGVWLGKRFTTDEHVSGLENGKVVRTRNVRPKSLEDTWSFDENRQDERPALENFQGLRIRCQLKKSMSTCPHRT